MTNDKIKVVGHLTIVLTDQTGKLKEKREVDNLVVTTGLGFIASRMKDATATAMSHMEVGTGATAAVIGDTALETAVGASRTALASTNVTANAVAYACTFGAAVGTGALTEAGLFNAGAAGTMLSRTVFSVINKGALDSLTITWTITVS